MFRHIALHVSLGVALLVPAMRPVVAPDVCSGTAASGPSVSTDDPTRSGYIVASS